MRAEGEVTIYEMSDRVRNYEIAFGGSGLARLYVETFEDGRGGSESTSRLHFDGEIADEVMAQVVDAVSRGVLASLPRGVCVVYKGHLVASFDYGAAARPKPSA